MRLLVATAAAVVLALSAASARVPGAVTPLLILGGLAITLAATRALRFPPALAAITALAYLVKVGATVVLYLASAHHWPLLPGVQLGDGFWKFGRDSIEYHRLSAGVLHAWRLGISLPELGPERAQVFYVALVYRWLGPQFLHVALLNAWYGTLAVIAGVLLTRRFSADRGALLLAAVVVGFWPSLILWSTQSLKDPLVITLIVVELYLVLSLAEAAREPWGAAALRWMAAAVIPFLVQFFREYLSPVMAVAVLFGLAVSAVLGAEGARVRRLLRGTAIAVVVLVPSALAANVNLMPVMAPAHPEIGHLRLGMIYHVAGNIEGAAGEYRKAIHLNDKYALAYRNLALAEWVSSRLHGGGPRESLRALERYQALGVLHGEEAVVAAGIAELRHALAGGPDSLTPELPLSLVPVDDPRPRVPFKQFRKRVLDDVARGLGPAVEGTGEGTRPLFGHGLPVVDRMSVENLAYVRRKIIETGGASVVDRGVRLGSVSDIIRYLPRGLVVVFFAPFPWQWFQPRGDTGAFKLLASVETVMMYLLVPCFVAFLVGLWRRRDSLAWPILLFVAALSCAFAAAIPNVGTLFRLRLQAVLPLVILLVATGSVARVWAIAVAVWRRSLRVAGVPAQERR